MENNTQLATIEQGSFNLMDDFNPQAIQTTLNKVNTFKNIIKNIFKEGYHFGTIPGTPKPSLWQPGAETILMSFGLADEYTVTDSEKDWNNGFFYFEVKCSLLKSGFKVAEGLGSCNTKEKKYQRVDSNGELKQDPYTLANTILKMAKKRALVDAAKRVAGLSDVFTQDIEDLFINGNNSQKQPQNNKPQSTQQNGNNNFISGAQAKRMFAISKGNELLVKTIIGKYSYNSSKEVKKSDYEAICKEIEDAAINPPINEDISEEFCNIIDDGFDDKIVGDKPY
jgi:hypothetical protein